MEAGCVGDTCGVCDCCYGGATDQMQGGKLSQSKNGQAEKYMQCLTKEEEEDDEARH